MRAVSVHGGENRTAADAVEGRGETRNQLHVEVFVAVVVQKLYSAGAASEKFNEGVVALLVRQPYGGEPGLGESIDNAARTVCRVGERVAVESRHEQRHAFVCGVALTEGPRKRHYAVATA